MAMPFGRIGSRTRLSKRASYPLPPSGYWRVQYESPSLAERRAFLLAEEYLPGRLNLIQDAMLQAFGGTAEFFSTQG